MTVSQMDCIRVKASCAGWRQLAVNKFSSGVLRGDLGCLSIHWYFNSDGAINRSIPGKHFPDFMRDICLHHRTHYCQVSAQSFFHLMSIYHHLKHLAIIKYTASIFNQVVALLKKVVSSFSDWTEAVIKQKTNCSCKVVQCEGWF